MMKTMLTPSSRSYASVAASGDFFYIFYGWNMDRDEGDYDIWKFDTIREEWSEVEIDTTTEGYDIVPRNSHAY